MNNYESLLPNKKALFDIPVARTASAYLTSLVLAISAFVADGSFNGGDNAMWVLYIAFIKISNVLWYSFFIQKREIMKHTCFLLGSKIHVFELIITQLQWNLNLYVLWKSRVKEFEWRKITYSRNLMNLASLNQDMNV